MEANKDFEEFFELLNTYKVNFLLIGGVAYNFYAPPRATKDIDIWVDPSEDNLRRFRDAVKVFGFPVDSLNVDELLEEARVIMLGRVPNRIDVLTRPEGLRWEDSWENRCEITYGSTMISMLSIDDLHRAKVAAGRPRDLADAAMLQRIRDKR